MEEEERRMSTGKNLYREICAVRKEGDEWGERKCQEGKTCRKGKMCRKEYDRIPARPEWGVPELLGIAVEINWELNSEVHPCIDVSLYRQDRTGDRSSFLILKKIRKKKCGLCMVT